MNVKLDTLDNNFDISEEKKLVSLFYFNRMISGKDMFLAPKYLSDLIGYNGTIVYPKAEDNRNYQDVYRGVRLKPIDSKSSFYSTFWTEKEMLWWLIKNARKIDVLFLFWLNKRNILFACVYKLLNPSGFCYIKGDFNEVSVLQTPPIRGLKKKIIYECLCKSIDAISAETKKCFEFLKGGGLGNSIARHSYYVPNAFDDELCVGCGLKIKSFSEKENIIITVGRIGHVEKYNEMVLYALDGIDMKGWRFYFVGPIELEFQKKYEQFIANNEDKADKVLLIGAMYDKKALWEIYNSAKVFVLTSPKEGFPNVFPEALNFGNYIITTEVSSSNDVTDNGTIGSVIPVNNYFALRRELCKVFDGEIDLENKYKSTIEFSKGFKWSGSLIPIVEEIKKQQYE